ncbi:MAG: cobalt transporter CbiM [Desulfovibrio sp.]|nr:cobalt transporter CbiM [Desulfovibrio sp.]
MHISEGVLSAPVLAVGAALAIGGVAVGLKKLKDDQVVLCGMLSAAFFVGSLVHVPVGVGNAHLLLTGLLGCLLGWAAFPAVFAALLLQALLFQYGGLTTLGVNTFCMGFSAVLSWYAFRAIYKIYPSPAGLKVAAFCGGFLGTAFGAILAALSLIFTDEGFFAAAGILLAAHLPVMLIEGLITMFSAWFIARVNPEMLALPRILNTPRSV